MAENDRPKRGRMAVVSHACVLPVNQHVYSRLCDLGWDLTLIVPARWRHEYSESRFAARALPSLESRFVARPVVLAGRPQRHFYARPLARLVRKLAPEVIVVEEETFSVAAAQWAGVANRLAIPFGVQADENLDRPLPSVARRLRRYTLSRAAFVMARSPAAAELSSHWGARGAVKLIPHAVPGWDRLPKRPDRPFTIGYAGRLVPEKGIRDLIAAVRLLEPPVKTLLVGDGVLRDELKEQVSRMATSRFEQVSRTMKCLFPTPRWTYSFSHRGQRRSGRSSSAGCLSRRSGVECR